MKIVHVVYSLEMGGAEVLVGQLSRLQRAEGHQVQIFAYQMLGPVGDKLLAEGFEIYVPGLAPALTTMRRYYRRLRELRPDVVHCHNVAPTIQAALPARLAGVPCVLSTRHRLELFPYKRKDEILYNLAGWVCDWITGICEVTCTNVKKGWFARRSRIVRVYNGVEPLARTSSAAPMKKSFTLVFVGRLAPEKALNVMIRAVGIAAAQVPDLQLWVVGEGGQREGWEALAESLGIRDRVTFWGQQIDPAPFFFGADVFVMSSFSEGLPMSLLQSMSIGMPSILTDVDGNGEVLRLTGGGLLVEVNNPEAFARAIVQIATDDALRQELAAKALTAYQRYFTLETMAGGYMTLYRKCLKTADALTPANERSA